MGCSESKEEKDDSEFIYDPKFISWDEHGNLKYGLSHPLRRGQQLKEILAIDFVDDEDGKTWYIMDSAWISSWLAYVYFDKDNAPAPGPCRNERLLSYDYVNAQWVGRFGLYMAVKDRSGDYRRVSKEVWIKFLELYPGSGPAITMVYNTKEVKENGEYDCSKWTIVDPPPAPEDKEKKKKKKNFIPFLGKKNAEQRDSQVDDSTSLLQPISDDANIDSNQPSNIAGLMRTNNEPKSVSTNINYDQVKGSETEAKLDDINPKVSSKRESFYEAVYFSKD